MIITLKPAEGPDKNTFILQQYLDKGGTIRLEGPGIYDLNGPLLIGDDTALEFGPGVVIRRWILTFTVSTFSRKGNSAKLPPAEKCPCIFTGVSGISRLTNKFIPINRKRG